MAPKFSYALSTASRAFPDNQVFKSFFGNATVFKSAARVDADGLVPIFKQLDDIVDDDIMVALGKGLDTGGRASMIKALDDAGEAGLKAKMFPDDAPASAALKNKKIELTMPGGTKKSVKYGSTEFWDAIKLGAMIGAGYGLLKWIDDKFEDAEEEYKNCMAGCLPHNWDAFDQGSIEKDALLYSNVASLEEYQITPVPSQPYCVEPNDKCEEYCDPKCNELSEVDLPFKDSPLNPFNPDSPLNPFKWLERLLPDGFDPKLVSGASSVSSLAVVALIVMSMVMKK
jgi:hypothetical protein